MTPNSPDGTWYQECGYLPPRTAESPEAARRRAVRYVASRARDVDDCALLLDALGLSPEDGMAAAAASTSAAGSTTP